MAEFSGTPGGTGRRFAIVASRFNEDIVQRLVDGALEALTRHGAAFDDIDIAWVPGAWELPSAARRLMTSERYNAIIALGAVIRGETAHYRHIATEAAHGLAEASAEFDIPVGFGVLTCDTLEQAIHRAGAKAGNKGFEAAVTAVEMVNLFKKLPG